MSPFDLFSAKYGGDTLISLATVDEAGRPWTRTVNAMFYGDSFYAITQESSAKMRHIRTDPRVAVSGDWFSAHGMGMNLGPIRAESNGSIAQRLRRAFSDWYGNGDVNEDDPDLIILRIRLTDGIIFHDGARTEFSV